MGRTNAPIAATWAATTLSLPIFPELADGEVDRVAAMVNAIVAERGALTGV